jgi:hypothetical protein
MNFILGSGMVVFALLIIGLVLIIEEFNKSG